MVARDVELGYISAKAAEEHYGVIVTADGEVDVAATNALRSQRAGTA
jgi:N-methylhydantoinase B